MPMIAPSGASALKSLSGGNRTWRNSIAIVDRITFDLVVTPFGSFARAARSERTRGEDRYSTAALRHDRDHIRAQAARRRPRPHDHRSGHNVARFSQFRGQSDSELQSMP